MACHPNTVVSNTICQDTHQRQAEGVELAATVDAMIVVGGLNSSNTNRLTEMCRAVQPRTFHVESDSEPSELEGIQLSGVSFVGLTSGASTPGWIIDRVEHSLRSRDPDIQGKQGEKIV